MFLKISLISPSKTPVLECLLIKLQAWEIFQIFKNIFFYRSPPVAVSLIGLFLIQIPAHFGSSTFPRHVYLLTIFFRNQIHNDTETSKDICRTQSIIYDQTNLQKELTARLLTKQLSKTFHCYFVFLLQHPFKLL